MKVFLSHSSSDEEFVERLKFAVQEYGHDVFLSSTALAPGQGFTAALRSEIHSSDLLVFVVSHRALRQGSYAVTELAFAEERWPRPAGHVLPVMLEAVPTQELPAYLQAVTICQTSGDLVAEAAARVDDLAASLQAEHSARSRARMKRWAAFAALLVGLGFGFWALTTGQHLPEAAPEATPDTAPEAALLDFVWDDFERASRGWLGNADQFVGDLQLRNPRDTILTVRTIHLQSDSATLEGTLDVVADGEVTFPPPWLVLPSAPERLRVRATWRWKSTGRSVPDAEIGPHRFRFVCETDEHGLVRSAWQAWSPRGEFTDQDATPLPAAIRRRVRCADGVPSEENGRFVLGLATPSALASFDPKEGLGTTLDVAGEPTAVLIQAGVAATRVPDRIHFFDPDTLRKSAESEPIPPSREEGGTVLSSHPASVAWGDGQVWVRTTGTDGPDALLHFDPRVRLWKTPSYVEDWEFDRRGLRLVSTDAGVLGLAAETTPASLMVLRPEGHVHHDGSHRALVQCATDALPVGEGGFLILDCAYLLTRVIVSRDHVAIEEELARFPAPEQTERTWEEYRIARAGATVFVAFNVSDPHDQGRLLSTTIYAWQADSGLRRCAHMTDVGVHQMTGSGSTMLVVLGTHDGRYDSLTLQADGRTGALREGR